ncbi:MAG: hypothetical protein C0418_05030 [Coriobacteriaceae bacterium]|nr:hypothetical protein [Coriobacteriaceae bacterium]
MFAVASTIAFTVNVQTAWADIKIVGGNGDPIASLCPAGDGVNWLNPAPVRHSAAGGGDVPGLAAAFGRLGPSVTFTSGPALNGTLTVDIYSSQFLGDHYSGGKIEARYQRTGTDPTNAQLRWLQFITTSHPMSGTVSPYIDPFPNDDTGTPLPFYYTEAENASYTANVVPSGYGSYDKYFYDFSKRPHPPTTQVTWRAHLFLVSWDGAANVTVHDGIEWGWDAGCSSASTVPTPTPVTSDGSPHGGYSTATKKCGVCHAVHHAGADGDGVGSEALLLTTRADACTYCHISPAVSGLTVYGGLNANYELASNRAHDSAIGDDVKCTSCHQVHAAANVMTPNTYLTTKILKDISLEHGAYSGSYLVSPTALMDADTAVTAWCSYCHGYFNKGINGASHVMTTTLGAAAFSVSTHCVSCHADDSPTSPGGGAAFPHYTLGTRFLTQSGDDSNSVPATVATDPGHDGVCLRCHRDGAGSGVGLHF